MSCVSCQTAKAPLRCGLCDAALCKSCARFLDQDAFDFLQKKPAELEHSTYCSACFESKVAPELAAYEDTMERAKDVNVFFKAQSKESRFIKRTEKPIHVEECADRDEVVMKLAFRAAEAGFNVLLDVETSAKKIHNGKWQTSVWSGSAIPASVDPKQLERKFL